MTARNKVRSSGYVQNPWNLDHEISVFNWSWVEISAMVSELLAKNLRVCLCNCRMAVCSSSDTHHSTLYLALKFHMYSCQRFLTHFCKYSNKMRLQTESQKLILWAKIWINYLQYSDICNKKIKKFFKPAVFKVTQANWKFSITT